MTAASPLVAVDDLSAFYGRAQALWNITLQVRAGEGVGVVGRNGAGKSTLLRTIGGVHRSASGSVIVDGQPTLGKPPHHVARHGVSLVREGAPVFTELSVLSNIELGGTLARFRGAEPMSLDDVWAVFPDLEATKSRNAGVLSGGQRQMLALATALMSRPTILLLDEPSAGLAPTAAATAFEAIGRMRSGGLAVLIAEQNRDWLDRVADRTIEIESGHIQAGGGTVETVVHHEEERPA
jgi:branched-chain amino acid transport system ATP-binding protein